MISVPSFAVNSVIRRVDPDGRCSAVKSSRRSMRKTRCTAAIDTTHNLTASPIAWPNATTGGDHSSQNKRNWCQGAEVHAARP